MPASFVFDTNRCTGCGACQVACTIENGLAPDVSWRRIETFNPRRHPIAPLFHLSLACHHCADAACMRACPALAYARHAATGAVLLDSDRCIGCGYCGWACPYDAPVFDRHRGVMTKCTWCPDRLRVGMKPACATHCPTGALDYAEVSASERVQVMDGLPRTDLDPSLHVVPLKPGRVQPEMAEFGPAAGMPLHERPSSGMSVRTEWPLAAFTLLAATLVAVVGGAAAGALRVDWRVFAALAALAIGLASGHLGRKARAWRALLNARRSWLSREVVLLSAFFALATAWLAFAVDRQPIGGAVVTLGGLGLLAADQVYGVLPGGSGHRHSAGALWMGLFLTLVFSGEPELATLVGAGKLWLYVARKQRFAATGRPVRTGLSAIRAGAGLLVPFALWVADPSYGTVAAALAVLGDAVDRCEYYLELERESPRRQLDLVLADRLAGTSPATGIRAATATS